MNETDIVTLGRTNGESPLPDHRDQSHSENAGDRGRIEQAMAMLSPTCRDVFARAIQEAAAANAAYLGVDHVLLGLAAEDHAATGRLFAELAISVEELRARLGFIQGLAVSDAAEAGELPRSPRCDRLLLAAHKDAVKRGAAEIGTLHLLGGLLTEREGIAVFILEEPGVGLERLGAAVQRAHREQWTDDVGARDEGVGTSL